MHNATCTEYKTSYTEGKKKKNLQIVQKYPAAFNNTIQVLLTRSVTLPYAHSSVSDAELAAQPGSPVPRQAQGEGHG